MIFETHAHYDDQEFDPDRAELLAALREKGVGRLINVGTTVETSLTSIEYAKEYDFVYAAVGIHPEYAMEADDSILDRIEELTKRDKVVAIGEIGLDYHYDKDPLVKEKQIDILKKQLEMAVRVDLPVIIHSRDAAQDTFNLMKDMHSKGLRGVMHCYSYSLDQALEYVKMGYYIGFGGAITFKNADKKRETVREIPLEYILLETDCPYMAPEPVRGTRNFSGNLIYIAEMIAKIKDIPVETVIDQTEKNAEKLFIKK